MEVTQDLSSYISSVMPACWCTGDGVVAGGIADVRGDIFLKLFTIRNEATVTEEFEEAFWGI